MKYEWTELTYQKILAGNTMVYISPCSVFLVYLVLAAQMKLVHAARIILIVTMTCFPPSLALAASKAINKVCTDH